MLMFPVMTMETKPSRSKIVTDDNINYEFMAKFKGKKLSMYR